MRRLNLTVSAGDVIFLPGASGCRESKALRLIAGLIRPTVGRIDWQGDQGGDDLGVFVQELTLIPWATVAQNVWLPFRLRWQSFASVRDQIAEALGLVGLDRFADAYRRQLSGGMKLGVSIAPAMVTNPRLILMDEPLPPLGKSPARS